MRVISGFETVAGHADVVDTCGEGGFVYNVVSQALVFYWALFRVSAITIVFLFIFFFLFKEELVVVLNYLVHILCATVPHFYGFSVENFTKGVAFWKMFVYKFQKFFPDVCF